MVIKDNKQNKYICPNHCNTSRMLNRGVNLALCSECGTMMVPQFAKKIRAIKNHSKNNKPFACSKCGKTGMYVLTVLRGQGDWCYECIKDKPADVSWTKKPIFNA
jgi:hypothetical protein